MLFAPKERQQYKSSNLWEVFKLIGPSIFTPDWHRLPISSLSERNKDLLIDSGLITFANFVVPIISAAAYIESGHPFYAILTGISYSLTKYVNIAIQREASKLAEEYPVRLKTTS